MDYKITLPYYMREGVSSKGVQDRLNVFNKMIMERGIGSSQQ